MNIKTSKDQTITGKDADTVAGLAVVGAVAIVGASAAAVAVGFTSLANRIGTGSWKIRL
ncbi:hypothetical protein PBI_SPORTO_35 [Arthrobacter phage Sporto]|nr:hypothetical protein PBI_SPORTO_35 [Arthrobacter phage Sporto]